MTTRLALLAALALVVALPVGAQAKGGRPDVRTTAACGSGVRAGLRLQGDDDGIRVRFEVDHSRAGAWRVVVVHERRIAWKRSAGTTARSNSFEVEGMLADYPGSDSVTARATGPRGVVCQVTTVYPDVSDDGDRGRSGSSRT
jgi:hypothetical protein